MRYRILSFAIALAVGLGASQSAKGCIAYFPMTKTEVALTDVMFEGSLIEVTPQSDYLELTFNVKRSIRGELSEDEIVVGWRARRPKDTVFSVETLTEAFGETSRVAALSPKLADKFCERKTQSGESDVEYLFENELICDFETSTLLKAKMTGIPFILAPTRCGAFEYFLSVEEYEKSRNYEGNLEYYTGLLKSGHISEEEFDEKVGYSFLPGGSEPTHVENIAFDLFRSHHVDFNASLKHNTDRQNELI